MINYATLDEALADVANRSFYENCAVYKCNGGFSVEDFHTGVEECTPWTYANGIDLSSVPHVADHSRVHEPYEFYDDAFHIRYNLPAAIEAIEEGEVIGFTYSTVEELCDNESEEGAHANGICLECEGQGASTVGWILIATLESN